MRWERAWQRAAAHEGMVVRLWGSNQASVCVGDVLPNKRGMSAKLLPSRTCQLPALLAGKEAAVLEGALGIPVLRHRDKKPAGGSEDMERHFGWVIVGGWVGGWVGENWRDQVVVASSDVDFARTDGHLAPTCSCIAIRWP